MDSAAIEKLESLLSRKSYGDLDPAEREFVHQQLGSAEEYMSMYEFNQKLMDSVPPKPDPRTLSSLQRRMRERENKTLSLQWLLRAKVPAPAFYISILGLITALLIDSPAEPQKSITKVERDTVFVTGITDTVFIEKVVYRPIHVAGKSTDVIVSSTQKKDNTSEGVSMREKQELEMLLESGS